MKAKMSYKSKRLAIIIAVIVVLIAAISIGSYYFIKGNDSAQAAYTENEQDLAQSNDGQSEATEPSGSSDNEVTQPEEQNNENIDSDDSQQPANTDNNADNNAGDNTSGNTNNNVPTSNDNTGTTGNDGDNDVPNQEYTQTDIIETEIERTDREVIVGWSNIALAKAGISTNITTNRPDLSINKVARINSINESDNAVQVGSKITYEISVTNNSLDVDANNVNISDIIPEGTKLDEETPISNNGVVNDNRINWTIDIASNSTVTVSFTVVVEDTDGEISNVAVVDGKDTPETKNPIIETNKTAASEDEVLEAGSELTYTISIENKGNSDAKTTVKDTVPAGTTLVEDSLEGATIEEVDEQKVITWNDVEIKAGEKVELSFTVTINKFKGESAEIKNTAVVGDTETNTDTETVYNPVISLEKTANPNKVAEGDTITYTITATNTGKVDGTATIKDTVPAGTTLVEDSLEGATIEEVNGQKVITWNDVEVAKNNGTATVSFKVTVNKNSGLTGSIENVAYLVDEDGNETPTDPTETEVEAHIIFVENGGTDVEDMDGVAGEAIENRNMPVTERAGYTFDGWYADEALTTKIDQLPENMVAGTTYYYAKWTANKDTKYTVEHYLQNLENEEFTLKETENLEGETDTTVTATPKTYEGFTFDENVEGTKLEGVVAGDGSLVLKVYYTRNSYKVTYEYEGNVPAGASELPAEATYKYGEKVEVAENATAEGYTFSGWDKEDFTMPAENVVIKGSFTANTNTKYTVEYYYEVNGEYPEKATSSDERTGTTDTVVNVTDEDKVPTQEGYVFDGEAENVLSGTIAGNGSLVLKVYFKQQFTVTYKPGEHGTFETQKTENIDYGTATPAFEGETTGDAGYTFAGWDKEVAETVTENVEYVAKWTANTDTKYTVEHYLQNLENEEFTLKETENLEGETDTTVTATPKTYEGFTFDENVEGTKLEGVVAGDGSLVLKVYYTRNSYKVTYEYEGNVPAGASELPAEATYKYGEKVEVAEDAIAEGYTFSGWDKEDFTMPAENVVIKGSFTANTNTKYIVEHYLQNLENSEYTLDDTEQKTGTTGEQTEAVAKDYPGFTAQPFEQQEIAGDGSTVIKIYYNRNTDTKYTVEYYYEVNGNYSVKPDYVDDTRTGTTGAEVSVTDADKVPAKEGYKYDEIATGKVESGIIAGDGSLTLKLYFTQEFTIKYLPGTHGTFDSEEYVAGYGSTTPKFEGSTSGEKGFYFAGWDKEISETVTGSVEYTALWEGLDISKTRTEIVDKDNLDNTFVDQAGDIIKYTITVKNVGDVNASNIQLTDDHKVKVTGVKIGNVDVDISSRDNSFEANENLLKGLTTTIEPNTTIEVTVEYTVTENELQLALSSADKAIVNTAIATLNNHKYTAKDETDGNTGTDVKERAEYKVEYYFNGKLNSEYTVEASTIVGATIPFERPSTLDGYTYIKYVGINGQENGSTTATDGSNVIKVYYGKAVINIQKTSTANVNAGDDIEYTITVSNTGSLSDTVTVTDKLVGTTYVAKSSKVDGKAVEPIIDGSTLSWEIKLNANETKVITFKATTAKDSFGNKIDNTAIIDGTDKKDTTTSNVNEIKVKYNEYKEGQKGSDLNILFVLDNSSSMNYPISGQSYVKNNNPIAPTDEYKTRIYNAKEAIKDFIDNQGSNPNTDMSVITFNTTDSSTETDYRTLMNIDEEDLIKVEEQEWHDGWWGFGGYHEGYYETVVHNYIEINGTRYNVTDEKVTGSDGNKYYGVYLPIETGARLVGTNSTSNEALKTAVDNISISSEKSGFGTYVGSAFSLINNNKEQYLSDTKKNIVIVLADGKFNGSYSSQLTTLKNTLKEDAGEIYCIGFGSGSDYDANALKNMSTNNTCYTATNSSDLLDQFNAILEEATGTEQSDTTKNGVVTFKQATGDIKVNEECPIEATYVDGNGETKTLFTCTSEADLSKYGLSISRGQITWDAKKFVQNNGVNVPGEVSIKYYIARS